MFTKEDKQAIARCIGFIVSGPKPITLLFGLSRQAHNPIRMRLSARASWRVQAACHILKDTGWFRRLCVDRARMLSFVPSVVLNSHGGAQ